MNPRQPILMARGISKRYGTVVALNDADFDLYPGEILGLIGDNGAGKTSLIKVLTGAVQPDHGEIQLDGKSVNFRSPQDARAAGIETVYQNLALSPSLSIYDNMFLGRELVKPGALGKYFKLLDRSRMRQFARQKLSELGLMTVQNIDQAVESLSGGQRQGVAVARAAAFGSRVVIMDEPTAALGVKEFAPRPRTHYRRQEARHADHTDLAQHAARFRSRRPHTHPSPRAAPMRRRSQESLDVGRRGDDDGRDRAAGGSSGVGAAPLLCRLRQTP